MKLPRFLFLFLTVSAAALMQQTSFAAQSQPISQPAPAQTSTQAPAQNSAGQDTDRSHDAHDAVPSSPADHANLKDRNGSDEPQAARPASARNRSRSHAHLLASSKNKIPLPQKRSSAKSASLHPARAGNSGTAEKPGVARNQTTNEIPAAHPIIAAPTTGTSQRLSLDTVRHHGPNPAVVSESANPQRSTGVINGTTMHRKP